MMNRRSFLQAASASASLSAFGANAAEGDGQDVKRVGVIGTGWYGKSDVFRLIQVAPVEVVCICDVDANMVAEAADLIAQRQKSGKKPRTYGDYRVMLAENKLDIVVIGTPDHWHALTTIAAVEAGAHVYVQKPTGVDVRESEAMLDAARRCNRVVQVGTQRRSTPHLIHAKKNIVEAGLLGKVAHVDMCCYYHMRANKKPEPAPVPDFLDYEMWTGPAPMRPYDLLPHRGWWRAFMEYSNGIVGDMCVHMFDATRWILDLGWPKRISSSGGVFVQKESSATSSDTQSATFVYDDLTVAWQHRSWGDSPDKAYPWAFVLYGEKGTLKASINSYDFIPRRKGDPIHMDAVFEREEYPEDLTEKGIELQAAPASRDHMRDFVAAIESGGRPVADIEQGHISSASCILANVAMKVGRTLVYDPEKREVVGDPEANALL
ncbi:MAG: Gfo/Idh/MocA family oxidoreductase, partial [bacterium]|nr:Gfo/Idh/MocA family oxidoreductase [bacterium]